MNNKNNCPFCNSEALAYPNYETEEVLWNCPVCGHFKLSANLGATDFLEHDVKNMIASYLFYNGIHKKTNSVSNYILLNNEPDKSEDNVAENVTIDQIQAFDNIDFTHKIDLILLDIAKKTKFWGDWTVYPFLQLLSMLFCKRWKSEDEFYDETSLINQVFFILDYLKYNDLIVHEFHNKDTDCKIKILSRGWVRIENIEQDVERKRNVFVAMSFDKSMAETRETIKRAIIANGFIPRIMDEIEHNHQIVPEMLYEIRQAKFVIAELTGHNNGAYFEAGYALGLDKNVIQVCKKDTFGADGHFDVKQVNTILWENQEDLYKRLDARIKATIS